MRRAFVAVTVVVTGFLQFFSCIDDCRIVRDPTIAHQLNGSNDPLPPPHSNVSRPQESANAAAAITSSVASTPTRFHPDQQQPTTSAFSIEERYNPLGIASRHQDVVGTPGSNISPHFTYPTQTSHMSAFSRLTSEDQNPNGTPTTTSIAAGQHPGEPRQLPPSSLPNAQQQAANMATFQLLNMMMMQQQQKNPSGSAQPSSLPPQANATSPLAAAPFLLNALANRTNPVDTLGLSALSPSVDLSPAAFASLGATSERRSSLGGAPGFTRPPLPSPIQTASPLLSPLFNNVAQQLASPLTPGNPEQGPLSAFATPHLPASLLSSLGNITASTLLNEILQRQQAQSQQAQLEASLRVIQAAALAQHQERERASHHPQQLAPEEPRSAERPHETSTHVNGFRFLPTEASTSVAGQRTIPPPLQHRQSLGQISRHPGSSGSLHSLPGSGSGGGDTRRSLSESHIPEQPYYPSHFMLGTRILCSQQNSTVKNVENIEARDFLDAREQQDEDMSVRLGNITKIDTSEFAGGSRIMEVHFNIQCESHLEKASMKAPAEFPFFEITLGWSSFDPVKTANLYGLQCRKLMVGDRCIIVLRELDEEAADDDAETESAGTSATTSRNPSGNFGPSETSPALSSTAGGTIRHHSGESVGGESMRSIPSSTAEASDVTGQQRTVEDHPQGGGGGGGVHSYIPGTTFNSRSTGNTDNAGNP